jgi:hypothetical protein
MKRLRIYLDTSVINFLYADDAPEKRGYLKRLNLLTPLVILSEA